MRRSPHVRRLRSEPRFKRELYLDVLWIAARSLIREGAPEAADLAREIRENLLVIDQSTVDDEVRERWFAVPIHAELGRMAAYERLPERQTQSEQPEGLDEGEVEILRLVTAGKADDEIAEEVGAQEAAVTDSLSRIFTKLRVSTRMGATQAAVEAGIV